MAITIVKPEDLQDYVGKELEATEWFKVDQDRINKFADATEDHQFIHVDSEKATPIFGSTIAHGFLSLHLSSRGFIPRVNNEQASKQHQSLPLLDMLPGTRPSFHDPMKSVAVLLQTVVVPAGIPSLEPASASYSKLREETQ